MRTGAVAMLIVGSIASSAHAVDGVREINQACASGPGCFAGDTAGLPVQITAQGSYRLTSNLSPPNQNTTVISISQNGVHVDLNGFAIQGTNTSSGVSCTASGTGDGVNTSANDVAVTNGHVLGMGSDGILLLGANSRIERVTAEQNCGKGLQVGFAGLVTDSVARRNTGDGITAAAASRVSNSVADLNGARGITSTPGSDVDLVVEGCVANANGGNGIFAGARALVRGCVALVNGIHGIAALGSSKVMENIANGNSSRGISVLGSAGAGDSTAVGLNVASGNGDALQISGGCRVGCNVINGVVVCPPSAC